MALTRTTVRSTFLPVVATGTPPSGVVVFTATGRVVTAESGDEVVTAPIVATVADGELTVALYPATYAVQFMLTGLPERHTRFATIPSDETPVWLVDCYTETSPPT